jgi:hypothetical protein
MDGVVILTDYGWYISHISEEGRTHKYPLHPSDIDYVQGEIMQDKMYSVRFRIEHDWCGIDEEGDLMSCDYGKIIKQNESK